MVDDATKQQIKEHVLHHHEGFPQTKDQLVAACNNMSEFSADVKEWFSSTLPDGSYQSGDEVIAALGI